MSKPNPLMFTSVLLVFAICFGGLPLLQDGLYLDAHEGDTYHVLDVLTRLQLGMRQHIDFATPLGVFVFLPTALLMKAGLSIGAALVWAQILVSAVLFPMVVYACLSRMSGFAAYFFAVVAIGLPLALTYGTADAGVSISMQYNRWGWSFSFVLMALAFLPPTGRSFGKLDGGLIGAVAAALLLIKVTYFVCILPPVVLFLLLQRKFSLLATATIIGCLIVGAITAIFGLDHWFGYFSELVNVSQSVTRPFVGVTFQQIIGAPAYLGATIVLFISIVLVRRAGHDLLALSLLPLAIGFYYITYQNFGNDPLWLLFIPPLLLTLRPESGVAELAGLDIGKAMGLVSVAAVGLVMGPLANLAMSPIKHTAIAKDQFTVMVPGLQGAEDIFVRRDRGHGTTSFIALADQQPDVWSKYRQDARHSPLQEIAGVTIPYCELAAGSRALFIETNVQMQAAGVPAGSQLFAGGLLGGYWLFGSYEPLQDGAPWYYGGLTGIENADYIVIPKCTFSARVRAIIIEELNAADLELSVAWNSDLMLLLKVN